MGCCGTKNGQVDEKNRRRLSVGRVDKCDDDDGEPEEEDRGLISGIDQSVIDVLAATHNEGDRKFSISSDMDQGKTSFANKTIKQLGDKIETPSWLGYTCRKGLKPESPNQDSWSVLNVQGKFSIYGVYDGHGSKGHDVSNFVKENLPKLILRDPRLLGDESMKPMLVDSFKQTQKMISSMDRQKKLQAQMSGTTATVCIHDHIKNKLIISHVADSTAVLACKDASGNLQARKLTEDHKPNLKKEKDRIEKAGGRVVFDGYANYRVYSKNGRYPGLNMSRCLGDLLGHAEAGCSCEPDVDEIEIGPNDEVLLMCSDGVWEFIEPQDAVKIITEKSNDSAQAAADDLAKKAWDKWITEEGGAVVDDITVILVYLQKAPKDNAP